MFTTPFLPKCSNLDELSNALEKRYHENVNELTKLAMSDDFDSNQKRTRLLAENKLIISIKTSINA